MKKHLALSILALSLSLPSFANVGEWLTCKGVANAKTSLVIGLDNAGLSATPAYVKLLTDFKINNQTIVSHVDTRILTKTEENLTVGFDDMIKKGIYFFELVLKDSAARRDGYSGSAFILLTALNPNLRTANYEATVLYKGNSYYLECSEYNP